MTWMIEGAGRRAARSVAAPEGTAAPTTTDDEEILVDDVEPHARSASVPSMARYFRSQVLPVGANPQQVKDALHEVEVQLMSEMVRIVSGPMSLTDPNSPGLEFHGYQYDK
jgi:hypothetical protein